MKKQGILFVILAIIIMGILAYWQYHAKPSVDNLYINKLDTSDWVEYTNNIYGYHLQIPPEYKNKSVYENTYIPLNSELPVLNLVNNNSSIQITTEHRSLFAEEGDLESILLQRANKYGYKIHKINNITFVENNSFPENGTTFSVAMEDRVLSITFTNVDQNIIDIIINTFKFRDNDKWRTYTNDKYGFSFKYPKDWTIYTQSDKYVSFNYSQTYLSTELTLFVFQNPNKESVQDFYNNIDENKKIADNDSLMYNWYASTKDYGSQKNIVVDGIEAVNFVSPMGIMENTTVSIPKDSLIVEIQIRGVEEIVKDSEYETILNTFKFRD